MDDELFRFVGVRNAMTPPRGDAVVADRVAALAEEFPDYPVDAGQGTAALTASLSSVLEASADHVLITGPDALTGGLAAPLAASAELRDLPIPDVVLNLGGVQTIAVERGKTENRFDVYRACLTVLGRHFGLTSVDASFALWLVKADALLGSIETGDEQLATGTPFEKALHHQVVIVPMLGPGWKPGDALARKPAMGDLLIVRQRLTGYHFGEVAAIENVMATEARLHRLGTERVNEQVTEETSSSDVSTEESSTLNERSELKAEISKAMSQQFNLHGDVRYSTSLGPVTKLSADVGGSFSTSSSESSSAASAFAKETTRKSVRTVTERTTSRRLTRLQTTIRDVEERRFDNAGESHRVGIYRWVEGDWEARLYKHPPRLLLEFLVPEPGAWLARARRRQLATMVDIAEPHPPTFPASPGAPSATRPLKPSDLTPTNIGDYLAEYLVQGVEPAPAETVEVAVSIKTGNIEDAPTQASVGATLDTLKVPDGYAAESAQWALDSWHRTKESLDADSTILLTIGGVSVAPHRERYEVSFDGSLSFPGGITGTVPVSIWGDLSRGVVGTVRISCRRLPEKYVAWQLASFAQITAAYAMTRQVYEARLAEAAAARESDIAANHLNLTQSHIVAELKKHVVSMLLGPAGGKSSPLGLADVSAAVHVDPAGASPIWVDAISPVSRDLIGFLEQAIDWHSLQYVTYAPFWSDADRWSEHFADSFQPGLIGEFLGAGAARVVVAVPLAFEQQMTYFLQTGTPWGGGSAPTPGEDTYVSVARELQERQDDAEEQEPEDTWTFSLPTNLVMLQPEATLPTFEE